ncbi:hypothetical protein QLG07_04850 [Erwinia sp. V90_4]|uniref:hypothetical protein n=1 Tax=Erwinia sp. V90_4 TaxID=3044239 RepID=UPI00249DB5B6|nr:hypothetical protein [Erwinia sp. V90_4]MDI3438777.1 hypothetical protein [Erwinia sp. V90_4]
MKLERKMNEKKTASAVFFIAITIAALVTATSSHTDKEALNFSQLSGTPVCSNRA